METTGKHTAVPWRVETADNGHTAVYPAGSRERVADIYCPLDVEGVHAANARLIASAPALLEACERMAAAMEKKSYPELQGVACDVFAAIRLAKGN